MQFMASSRRQSFILNYEDYAGFKKKNNASLPFLDSNRKKGKKNDSFRVVLLFEGSNYTFFYTKFGLFVNF